MNKEDILKAAQKEKKGSEFEQKSELKSNLLSAITALIVGAFLFFFEYLKTGALNWGIATMVLTACATQSLYEGIKIKKLAKIILGVILALLAVVALAAAIAGIVR